MSKTTPKTDEPKKEVAELPQYYFKLSKCVLDAKSLTCSMDLSISSPPIKKVHKVYKLTFFFDPEPWDDRIGISEEQINKIKSEPSLLASEDQKRIKDLQANILNEKTDKRSISLDCATISFVANVKEVKYGDDTRIIFEIPRNNLGIINEKLQLFQHYKLTLEIV